MITAGLDVGNQSVKTVILGDGGVMGKSCIVIVKDVPSAAQEALDEALREAGVSRDEVEYIVTTGIGKEEVGFSDDTASDLSCHTRGAQYELPNARTVIDMGAENCRVSLCDEKGKLIDFAMNDKCASGTGVFLETIAKMMEVPLEELGPLSLQSDGEVSITTMCAVFAESEVVTEVHRGTPSKDIIKGCHDSIALRTTALLKRTGMEPDIVMTGGAAWNVGLVESIKRQINMDISVPPNPQISGALGAAIVAREKKGGNS
jgi:benzoyl-CoA reductase subunit D